MAASSSTPARQSPTTVYGLDPVVWRQFRAWCDWYGLSTGQEVQAALLEWMRSRPAPGSPEAFRLV